MRIKRVDFVANITESIYRRMEAERKHVANELRSTGAAEGEKIRADADRQREVIVAEAYRDAQKIKGEGDAKASAIFAEAFGRDPQFAQFYRSLEAYRQSFRNKSDVMVLDPRAREFFKAHARRRRLRRRPRRGSSRWRASASGTRRLWCALALVLVVEGCCPSSARASGGASSSSAMQMSDGQIRFLGLCSMLAGLADAAGCFWA